MAKHVELVDKREGYVYDTVIKQYDTTFWKATAGTPAASSNKLRNSAAAVASFIQHICGDFEFAIASVAPTAGLSKHWGLRLPATDSLGAIYFNITGAVFSAITIDPAGVTQSTAITWVAGWTNTETKYRIKWEPNRVQFLIGGVIKATHDISPCFNDSPLPLRIVNADADNLDMGYVAIRNAGLVI